MAGAKEMIEQVVSIFRDMGMAQKMMAGVLLAVVVGGLIMITSQGGGTSYQVLFSSLNQEDAADVVAKLQEMRVPYELAMNGSAIKVPSDKVLDTRLALAGEGLPRGGGVGFEIFDRTSLGATDFVQKLNYQRALQGELSRTIRGFHQVQEARVHIATPKESIFIEEEKPPSASVSLKMRGKNKLNSQQIQAIVNLVGSAVPGLTEENITVVDTSGRLLFRKRGDEIGAMTATQLEYQLRLERTMRDKVESMLQEIVGHGKALARISTQLEFNQVNTTEEIFDPEGQVVRSEQVLNEEVVKAGEQPQGIPGVKGNLATFAESNEMGATAKGSNLRNNMTRNYEISKTTKQVREAAGVIQRLSVAVMVDGTYEKSVDEEGNTKIQYTPRSPDELKHLEKMVRNAVGYDPERGDRVEVAPMSFASSMYVEPPVPMAEKIQPLVTKLAMPFVYLIIAICVIFFVIRPFFSLLSKKQMEVQRRAMLAEAEAISTTEEEEDMSLKPVGVSDRERIYKLAQSDPDRAADLVRRWLREEV